MTSTAGERSSWWPRPARRCSRWPPPWRGTRRSLITLAHASGRRSAQRPARRALGLVSTQFEADRRVKAMGWWGLVMAVGPVIGVSAGGPLADATTWRLLFFGQAVLIVVAMVAAVLVLPDSPRVRRRPLRRGRHGPAGPGDDRADRGGEPGAGLGLGPPAGRRRVRPRPGRRLGVPAVGAARRRPVAAPRYLRRRNFSAPIMAASLCTFSLPGRAGPDPPAAARRAGLLHQPDLGAGGVAAGLLRPRRPGGGVLRGALRRAQGDDGGRRPRRHRHRRVRPHPARLGRSW